MTKQFIKAGIVAFVVYTALFSDAFAREYVRGVSWDQAKKILEYGLTQDSSVKIRAGSPQGVIYRALVNLEKRKAGKNQEVWNGKDETGSVDFTAYEPNLYFMATAMDNLKKDLFLKVDFSKKTLVDKNHLVLSSDHLAAGLDIDKKDKAWFTRKGIEVMVFVDNRLIKLMRPEKLPCQVDLVLKNVSSGDHLLSFNVWSGDQASVAYKSVIVSVVNGKSSAAMAGESGSKFAYCRLQGGYWQIFVCGLDGKNPLQLTKTPVDKLYPSFSPDGKKIAFVTNAGELWTVGADGENDRKIDLPVGASQPRFSPDGRKIAFVSYQDFYSGDTELWQIDLVSGKAAKLLSRPLMQYDLCWSPDQTDIIFVDGLEHLAQGIYRYNFKSKSLTEIMEDAVGVYDTQPAYSPDGKTIVYSSNKSGTYNIWLMDKFGQLKTKRNLTNSKAMEIRPRFSADGRQIYFLSDASGFMEVWRIDADGKNLTQITDDKCDKQDMDLYETAK